MLARSATPNMTLGQSFVKPSDLPRAVAQTASSTPERIRTSQYTTVSLASLVTYPVLIRRREPLVSATLTRYQNRDRMAGAHSSLAPQCAPCSLQHGVERDPTTSHNLSTRTRFAKLFNAHHFSVEADPAVPAITAPCLHCNARRDRGGQHALAI